MHLRKYILKPRNLNHKLHFTGRCKCLKLAEKNVKYSGIYKAFHGCSLGALSLQTTSVSMLSGVHINLGNECDTSEILKAAF